VGTAVDLLEKNAFARRTRVPGERADRIAMKPAAGEQSLFSPAELAAYRALAQQGLDVLADASPARRRRLLEYAAPPRLPHRAAARPRRRVAGPPRCPDRLRRSPPPPGSPGRATVLGHDVVAEPLAVRRRIGLAGQFAAVDEELTGRENVEMVGRLYRLSGSEARARAAEVLERFELAEAADRRVSTYWGGMRRRLDLGASLVGRPPVILLDEPTAGLDRARARSSGTSSRSSAAPARSSC
jgi:energy-coupling factor transporter ATP-binding protein EcfA2